jgi:hypothetical protein
MIGRSFPFPRLRVIKTTAHEHISWNHLKYAFHSISRIILAHSKFFVRVAFWNRVVCVPVSPLVKGFPITHSAERYSSKCTNHVLGSAGSAGVASRASQSHPSRQCFPEKGLTARDPLPKYAGANLIFSPTGRTTEAIATCNFGRSACRCSESALFSSIQFSVLKGEA